MLPLLPVSRLYRNNFFIFHLKNYHVNFQMIDFLIAYELHQINFKRKKANSLLVIYDGLVLKNSKFAYKIHKNERICYYGIFKKLNFPT